MAKQDELRGLLKALRNAHNAYSNAFAAPPFVNNTATVAAAMGELDKAEKRIYSFFDVQRHALELSQKEKLRRGEQIAGLLDERKNVDSMLAAAQHEPFDAKRAAAGDPIEVQMSPYQWIEKRFIGKFSDDERGTMVCYVHDNKPDFAPPSCVRMKAKPVKTLQMYAQVFRDGAGMVWGICNRSHTKMIRNRISQWLSCAINR